MAGAQFEYDEKGTTFYYFVLCFFAILLIPLTYFTWIINSEQGKSKDTSRTCNCPKCVEKRVKKLKLKPKSTFLRIASRIVVVLLWFGLLYGVYRVAQFEKDFIEYDPFAVLEIDKGATAVEIKRQYRKLSLVYHPDKETGDEKKFMRIAKAYEALTNEESRKNWEEHGNPDGPRATTFGIALPSWIVSEENSFFVLGAYVFAFMFVLPIVVGTWWYRSIKYGCDQVLMDTTRVYFHFFRKTPCMQIKRVIMVFSGSMEFEKSCNQEVKERPSDNVELPRLLNELQTVNENTKEWPFFIPFSVKCRALILAHLDRLSIPEDTLQNDLELLLKKAPLLIQEMISCISQLFYYSKSGDAGAVEKSPRLDTVENVIKFSQMIVQALRENKSPLLQLPHLTQEHLRYFTTKKRNVKTVRQLLEMKKRDRRDMMRFLSDEQYEDVLHVAGMMPHIVPTVTPHVMDDEDQGLITAGAVVTVTIELKRSTLKEICAEDEDDEEENVENLEPAPEIDTEEEAKVVVKNKVWQKTKRKGKKAKPVKQQPKKKTAKQLTKPKDEVETKEEEKANEVGGKKEQEKEKKEKREPKRKHRGKEEGKEQTHEEEIKDDGDGESSDFSGSEFGSYDSDGSISVEESLEDGDDDDEWHRMQQGVDKLEKVLDTKLRLSHDVHSPFFPGEKQEFWWVYICDRKKQEMVTVPSQVVNLTDTETVKLQFQAPVKCGHFSYTAVVRSDSYLDVDVMQNFKIQVHEAKEVETKQWDFESDEEEDKDDESGESEWDEEEESD